MSVSTSTAHIIQSLDTASTMINRYLPILIYIFGLIGNCLNILVLGQRQLRANPSAACFLLSSSANLIVLISGLTSRMMSGFAVDLTLTVGWICKTRNVVLYTGRTVALWAIVLAAIDRWLSSSMDDQVRRQSSLRNSEREMMIILVGSFLINIPIIFCYEANLAGVLRGCYGSTDACRIGTDLIYAIGTTILPLMLMAIFGTLTIKNIRHARNRIETATGTVIRAERKTSVHTSQHEPKKRDRQLLKMLLVQVIIFFLFTCPHPIQKAYTSIASTPPPDSLENAINNFIFNCLTLLTFTSSGMTFYIYTLSGGSVFRKALLGLIKKVIRRICCCL